MPVKIEPGTDLARQLAKFEQFPTAYTTDEDPPGNPYVFRPYPKLLYKAITRSDGRAVCMEPQPVPRGGGDQAEAQFQYELLLWERHTQACCKRVQSADEERQAQGDGWRATPKEALDHHEALQQDIAKAAAESAYAAQRMTSKAQAERTKLEQTSSGHVTK